MLLPSDNYLKVYSFCVPAIVVQFYLFVYDLHQEWWLRSTLIGILFCGGKAELNSQYIGLINMDSYVL